MDDLSVRRLCRIMTNVKNNMPVNVVEGYKHPEITGESWHYKTNGGKIIHYPSAYSKVGWSNMIYYPSTKSIEVGREWIMENLWAVALCQTCECFTAKIKNLLREKLT